MLLESFQITRFGNFVDSGSVVVQPDVTCLVGKNESGKSVALQALRRIKPARDLDFSVEKHYPRWLMSDDRDDGVVDATVPISATLRLEAEDLAAATAEMSGLAFKSETIVAQRDYANELSFVFEVDEGPMIERLLDDSGVPADIRGQFGEMSHIEDLTAAVKRYDESRTDNVDEDDEAEDPLEQLRAALDAVPHDTPGIRAHATDFLAARLPVFYYFGEYSGLPGRIDLGVLGGENVLPAEDDEQTARALLKLARTDIAKLGNEDYEVRKADLEAASIKLTKQVKKYWSHNQELAVDIDIDKQTVNQPNGQTAVARWLEIRVKDTRHGYSNNFEQRSSGFQWFFSFLAGFSEFERSDERVIVLLDEPGLTLHGKAQADFLRFINERLVGAGHQVIYTTHSPFMVETGRTERVRIVEDRGEDEHGEDLGAHITNEPLARDPDSLFPLQGALGYDIAQHLLVGGHNLLIEGTSDFIYFDVLSRRLAELGRLHLDDRWSLLPVGGADKLPPFVRLLGRHLDVTVVMDADTRNMERLKAITTDDGLLEQRLIAINEITRTRFADVEDLFDVDDYLKVYNGAFNKRAAVEKLPPGDRIVKRLEQHHEPFDHGLPAVWLLRNQVKIVDALSDDTLERFERLFARINSTLTG